MSRYDEKCKFDAWEDEIATAYEERTGLSYAEHKSNTMFKRFIKHQVKSDDDYKRICKAIDTTEKMQRLIREVENLQCYLDEKAAKNKSLGEHDPFYGGKISAYEDISGIIDEILEGIENE